MDLPSKLKVLMLKMKAAIHHIKASPLRKAAGGHHISISIQSALLIDN